MSLDELQFTLLRTLEQRPQATQRQLADELKISLGKVNYCLKKLVEKGWIKLENFNNSQRKSAYLYLLTPQGDEEKGKLTMAFLKQKMEEYDRLRLEIEQLQNEAQRVGKSGV